VLANDLDEFARGQIDETAVSEAAQTPESALIAKAEAEGVRKAVASLPAHFREVLVLREIHDLNYRTIAEVVGIPIGTVMSQLARARRLLIEAIEGSAA